MSDIYVAEGWRRRGVGASLLRRIETEMRRRGCRRIRICAKATNRAALACYAAAGYPPYEIIFSKAID